MASAKDKKILKENGHITMDALKNINVNPTLNNLAKYIAEKNQIDKDGIKAPLKDVLEKGIELGLVEREKGKYYVSGNKPETSLSDEDDEPGDATKRRRRAKKSASGQSGMASKPKSKSRSRSRSRKRKSAKAPMSE